MSEGIARPRARVHIVVDQELLAQFRVAIIEVHGTLLGVMAREWDEALKLRTEDLRKRKRGGRVPIYGER